MTTRTQAEALSRSRPSGTVTFLFSDIEGSTARWDADRIAMASALSRHDSLMRAALDAHGGYVFKTMGDAFCAAFRTASDAADAALEAQRALRFEDFSAVHGLRVRMALHSGTAEERDSDYFGPEVNRIARLLAIGHGGQILVSAAAVDLLRDAMPSQASLLDLGAHRLKDLTRPEQVFQLAAPDLSAEFPPLRSLEHLTNNLPAQLTTFVGRDREISEIVALLAEHRLVTLTGAGGAGKTRCAIRIGADLLNGWKDGIWLAELAPLADSAQVANAIAQVLHVQEQPNSALLDTIVAYLKHKRLLLLLDNCEHLIEQARRAASAILRDCPGVRILATSREPLNISGEAAYRMPSLAVPPNAEMLVKEGTSAYGSAQLFLDRALLSSSRFTLSDENASSVVELCRRLDGIPLAIELAAARVKILSPQQLVQKLDERFRVLTGGDRRALPRHQTMRALIDWSYDLLSPEERAFFRKLSIFAGGFTLESAAAANASADEIDVLDLLSSLVDKSLVQAELTESGTRYGFMESTRQYARERLRECGEEQDAARGHAFAFGKAASQIDNMWETLPDSEWLARVGPEMENYRAALHWAFGAQGDVTLGQRLSAALRKAWISFGVTEGRRWLKTARERSGTETPAEVVAALDLSEASLASGFHQFETTLTCGERGLETYRELGDPQGLALAKEIVGDALVTVGKIEEGTVLLQEALAERRALGARKSVAGLLVLVAQARWFAGDTPEARKLFAEALTAARAAGGKRLSAIIASNFAECEFDAGDGVAAVRLVREAATILREINDAQLLPFALTNEAGYLLALQRYDEARSSAIEALAFARDLQYAVPRLLALQRLAAVAALRPDDNAQALENMRCGARLFGYVNAGFARLEESPDETERMQNDSAVPVLRDALGTEEVANLMHEGSFWTEDRALAEAMQI